MLPAGIPVWPLRDTCDAEIGNAEIGQHGTRGIELALPAVDQHEVGPGLRPIGISFIGGLALAMLLEEPGEPRVKTSRIMPKSSPGVRSSDLMLNFLYCDLRKPSGPATIMAPTAWAPWMCELS